MYGAGKYAPWFNMVPVRPHPMGKYCFEVYKITLLQKLFDRSQISFILLLLQKLTIWNIFFSNPNATVYSHRYLISNMLLPFLLNIQYITPLYTQYPINYSLLYSISNMLLPLILFLFQFLKYYDIGYIYLNNQIVVGYFLGWIKI